MAEQEKGPCPANDNGCPAASPLIPAFSGLPKPLADNLLVRRVSLRPPPMTMNDGDDSHVGNGFPKAGLAAHRALNEPTRLDIGTCHRCEALIWRQAMPKVALYARYSADNQSVVSIEDQFRICRKHAGRERWQVVDTYHDAAISGASVILRSGVQSLLQDASVAGSTLFSPRPWTVSLAIRPTSRHCSNISALPACRSLPWPRAKSPSSM